MAKEISKSIGKSIVTGFQAVQFDGKNMKLKSKPFYL